MARVLVTGANGQIGCNLVRQLRADDHQVVAMVREGADLRGIESLGLELRRGDVLDAQAVAAAVEGAEVVAHLAAVYDMRARDPEAVMKPAVEGVRNVLAAAKQHGVRRLVHISSAAAVGMSKTPDQVRTEADWNDDATVAYYHAKTVSERRAWELAEELGVSLVVLCPSMVLGPYDFRVTPSTQFVRALVDGSGMTGRGSLNVVDVRDVAVAISRAVDRGPAGERYITGGDTVSQQELGAMVGELTGNKPTHLPAPRFAAIATVALMSSVQRLLGKEPVATVDEARLFVDRYCPYDSSKARQALDWHARPAREAIDAAIRWMVFAGQLPAALLERLRERFPPDPAWAGG